MSLSVPKEALVTKQPTAEQTATIRGAYANANIPAETTTSIIQNPSSAQAAYGNIATASQPNPQTTETTSPSTQQTSLSSPSDYGLTENFATKAAPGRANLTPGLTPARYVTSDYGLSENVATKVSPGRANLSPGVVQSEIFTVTEPALTNALGRRVKPLDTTTTQTVEQQFPIRNPLTAQTLLGGFQILGSDVQNLFAGAATNLSTRAQQTQTQNLTRTAPNTPQRFIGALPPAFEFEAAGFYQSIGLVTGKFGNVQTNIASEAGFGVGVGAQAVIGGEAYAGLKSALGITTLGRSIAFGSTTFAGLNAGLTAAQGGSPIQVLESTGIGAALGGGSEALAGIIRPLSRSTVSFTFTGRSVSTPSISLGKQVAEQNAVELANEPNTIDLSKATLANAEEVPSQSASLTQTPSAAVYSSRSGQALLQENIQTQKALTLTYTSQNTARTISEVATETALTAQLTKLLIAARIRGLDLFTQPEYLTYPPGTSPRSVQVPQAIPIRSSVSLPSLSSDYIQGQLSPQREATAQLTGNVQAQGSQARQLQTQVQLQRSVLIQQQIYAQALGFPVPTLTRTKQRRKRKAKPKKRRYKEITERIPFERVLFG